MKDDASRSVIWTAKFLSLGVYSEEILLEYNTGKASFLISLVLPDTDPRQGGLWFDQIDVFWRLRVRVENHLRVGEKGSNSPASRISQGVGTA